MIVDMLTKPVQGKFFQKLRRLLMNLPYDQQKHSIQEEAVENTVRVDSE